ncbi:hypothetical protein SY83_19105 [Paenibacillus swuensis]|uniref:Uncharacterized protein n=1 Tax=Paenibacillus swuensis TaxID=1178515 RepID=A0A172TLY2_9BACL|nr:hypothetical protein [Paenibacillus swuensis]ANE48051.1 hypothetical protein SY83_19105 [Paenibacillus swuensis]
MSQNKAPLWPTDEEQGMIKEFLLLPLVLTVFERDTEVIGNNVKTKAPYVEAIALAMDRVTLNLAGLKKEFRLRGIKVFDGVRTEHGIRCSYLCRGYENQFDLMWTYVKAEVELRMKHYLGTHLEVYLSHKTKLK